MIGIMVRVRPQGRRMGETIWSNCNCSGLISIHLLRLLHSSPGYVTSDPRGNILVDFDHDEEKYTVCNYHTEDNTQVNPL